MCKGEEWLVMRDPAEIFPKNRKNGVVRAEHVELIELDGELIEKNSEKSNKKTTS